MDDGSSHAYSNPQYCPLYVCDHCNLYFDNDSNLDEHLSCSHIDLEVSPKDVELSPFFNSQGSMVPSFPCNICGLVLVTWNSLCAHKHRHESIELLTSPDCQIVEADYFLPQVDGPLDELTPSSSNLDMNFREEEFQLNQNKQVKELQDDANIQDFEVTINNYDENATIKCNSGFYFQVAKPSFSSLSRHTTLYCLDVSMTVTDITLSYDKNKYEVKRFMHFKLMNHQEDLAVIAVHLYHTTRRIQVQGSAVMPDNSKAAKWFTLNFVVQKFQEQAKLKQYLIRDTNNIIIESSRDNLQVQPENHQSSSVNSNTCHACKNIFSTNSKSSICQVCSCYVHRKCIKDHKKICKSIPSSNQILSSSTSRLKLHSSTTGSRTITFISPEVQTAVNSDNDVRLSQPTIDACSNPSSVRSQNASIPTAIVTTPCVSTSTTQSINTNLLTSEVPPTRSQSNPRNKPKNHEQDLNITYLKRELASAQTRITKLDAEVNDKDKRISILLSRLEMLESRENQATHDRYSTPGHYNSRNNQCVNYCHASSSHQQSCCCSSRPYCSHSVHGCNYSQHHDVQSSSESVLIAKELKEALVLMKDLIHRLEPRPTTDVPSGSGASNINTSVESRITIDQQDQALEQCEDSVHFQLDENSWEFEEDPEISQASVESTFSSSLN